jgi:DNA-binding Xre family transcriptional regulator
MGIKQTAICRKTGITIDRMSAMNRNKARMTADEYESICKALEKQPNDFMEV